MTIPELTNLSAVLAYLAAGGGAIVAAWIVSVVLDKQAWFIALSATAKQFAAMGIAGLFGLAAWAIVTYVPASVLEAIAPAYSAFMLSALAAGAGQVAKAARNVLKARIS